MGSSICRRLSSCPPVRQPEKTHSRRRSWFFHLTFFVWTVHSFLSSLTQPGFPAGTPSPEAQPLWLPIVAAQVPRGTPFTPFTSSSPAYTEPHWGSLSWMPLCPQWLINLFLPEWNGTWSVPSRGSRSGGGGRQGLGGGKAVLNTVRQGWSGVRGSRTTLPEGWTGHSRGSGRWDWLHEGGDIGYDM